MTTNVTTDNPFAGFAPGEHRKLLADLNHWRRTNGWNWGHTRGLVNGRFTSEATTAVDWLPAGEQPQGFVVTRRGQVSESWPGPDFYPAADARQAVDLLVALGILPVNYSSAYEAGVIDGAEQVPTPAPSANYDSAVAELAAAARDVIAAGWLTRDDSDDPDAERGRAHSRLIAAESGWLREYAKQVTR